MNSQCILLSATRLALVTLALCAPTCYAQQPPPKSGALVALDAGQTLWIAPADGKLRVIAADDYVIPRKDGFWRIHLESRLPANQDSPNPEFGIGNGIQGQLWTVPLQSGSDAVPWPAKPAPVENAQPQTDSEAAQNEQNEGNETEGNRPEEPVEETVRRELHFLSPDHISFYTEWGEYASVSWRHSPRAPRFRRRSADPRKCPRQRPERVHSSAKRTRH
jgi:hypothetical protein